MDAAFPWMGLAFALISIAMAGISITMLVVSHLTDAREIRWEISAIRHRLDQMERDRDTGRGDAP